MLRLSPCYTAAWLSRASKAESTADPIASARRTPRGRARRPRGADGRHRQRTRRAVRRRRRPHRPRQGARRRHRDRQVGPRGPQGRRDPRLDGHAGALRPSGRGEPRRPRHGPARGRHPGAVVVGRDDGACRPHRLRQALPRRPRRHYGERRLDAGPPGRYRSRAAEGPGGLPQRPRADHLDHHAAGARRRLSRSRSSSSAASRRTISASSIRAASSGRSSSSCATSCTWASAFRL
jgi:hypothetical protein